MNADSPNTVKVWTPAASGIAIAVWLLLYPLMKTGLFGSCDDDQYRFQIPLVSAEPPTVFQTRPFQFTPAELLENTVAAVRVAADAEGAATRVRASANRYLPVREVIMPANLQEHFRDLLGTKPQDFVWVLLFARTQIRLEAGFCSRFRLHRPGGPPVFVSTCQR